MATSLGGCHGNISCSDNATQTTEGCLCACRSRIWAVQHQVGRDTPSTDTVNRLFLAGHGDLEEILSVTAREPDRPRSLPIVGVQARQNCQAPPEEEEEEEEEKEEEEGAITITDGKQSHGSLPQCGRLWGAISSWGKPALGGRSPKATQGAPPRARESETFSPKCDFCHARPSWTLGQGVNRGKDAAVGWVPHAEGLCRGRRAPPHLLSSPRTPRRNLLPCKTLATEAGAVPTRGRAREEALLAFVFTMGEISLAISITLGSPEFSRTRCLGLG